MRNAQICRLKFWSVYVVTFLIMALIYSNVFKQKYGLKVYLRDPTSYTPLIKPGGKDGKARSLTLWRDHQKTAQQIAQFSEKDAQVLSNYIHVISANTRGIFTEEGFFKQE